MGVGTSRFAIIAVPVLFFFKTQQEMLVLNKKQHTQISLVVAFANGFMF